MSVSPSGYDKSRIPATAAREYLLPLVRNADTKFPEHLPTLCGSLRLLVLLACCAGLFRLMAFLRELLVAHEFGTNFHADAYIAAIYLPQFFFMLFSNNTLSSTLVPYFLLREQRVRSVLRAFLLVGAVFSTVLFVGARRLTATLFPGLDGPTLALAIGLSKLMAPCVFFLTLSVVLTAVFQARESFALPAFSGLALVGTMLVSVPLAPQLIGIYTIGVGLSIGAALQALMLSTALRRTGWAMQSQHDDVPMFDWSPLLSSLPVLVVSLCFLAVDILVRYFGSRLGEGSISALVYASKIVVLPGAVIGVPVSVVVLPRLVRIVKLADEEAYKRLCMQVLGWLIIFLVPFAALSYVLRNQIIAVVFQHGAFATHSVALAATALGGFSISILFGPITILLQTFFYARGDLRTPGLSCFPLLLSMVVAGHLLTYRYEIFGVSAAYSIAWLASAVLLMGLFARNVGPGDLLNASVFLLKVSVAGIAAVILALHRMTNNAGSFGENLRILCEVGTTYLLAYGVALIILHPAGIRRWRQMLLAALNPHEVRS